MGQVEAIKENEASTSTKNFNSKMFKLPEITLTESSKVSARASDGDDAAADKFAQRMQACRMTCRIIEKNTIL